MRKPIFSLAVVGVTSLFLAGCAAPNLSGPERKFGRGLNNSMEFVRGGEIRRSLEQTAIFGGPDVGYSAGFFHGFNRSIHRTAVGIYEMATAPFPNAPGKDYGPIYLPENPVYPASYTPGIVADQIFATDRSIGFSGGEVAPFVQNSRFRVFDE